MESMKSIPTGPTEFNPFLSPKDLHTAEEQNPNGRFIAGEQFYNYEIYGSLRKGGAVRFYSRECYGLVAATFTSVFSYCGLQMVLRPLLRSQLNLTSEQNRAVQRLIELPMALGFLIGLLSDCYPLFALRRKAYMIVGLVLNAVSVLTIAGLSAHMESMETDKRSSGLVTVVILMSAAASFGCMFTYLCVHTRVIELSQREPLGERGKIQADYLIFRRIAQLFCAAFTFFAMNPSGDEVRLKLSNSTILLAIICVLPLPIILKYWKEDLYSLTCSMKIRANIFWKIIQQKAVWRVLLFISFFTMFIPIRFTDSSGIVRNWANASKHDVILIRVIQDVTVALSVLLWRQCFMNRPWRWIFCWVPIMEVLPQLILSALVCLDVTRDQYFYRAMMSLMNLGDGANALTNITPLTEIIQEGSEGVTVGLVLSLQRLIGVFVRTSSSNMFRGDHFYNPEDVAQDGPNVRTMVFVSLVVNYLLNSLSAIGLIFLPSQKLDAQQLRMYGGFTSFASIGVALFSIALFVYSTTLNVMTFMPSLSCLPLVGGTGC